VKGLCLSYSYYKKGKRKVVISVYPCEVLFL